MCGAGILGRKAAKRASGRSTFLKVSLLTDNLTAVTSHFHKVTDLQRLTRAGRNHYTSSKDSHSVPLPLIVFPAHFFFRMFFARSTQDKRHGPGRIFYLCNPFRGNVQILVQIVVLFAAQKLHGSAGRV